MGKGFSKWSYFHKLTGPISNITTVDRYLNRHSYNAAEKILQLVLASFNPDYSRSIGKPLDQSKLCMASMVIVVATRGWGGDDWLSSPELSHKS